MEKTILGLTKEELRAMSSLQVDAYIKETTGKDVVYRSGVDTAMFTRGNAPLGIGRIATSEDIIARIRSEW
jgi:hypothetical protein